MSTENMVKKAPENAGGTGRRLLEEAAESGCFAVFAAILFQLGILLFIGSLLCSFMNGLCCWFERRRDRRNEERKPLRLFGGRDIMDINRYPLRN